MSYEQRRATRMAQLERQLRQSAKYLVISDKQLKRDLKERTLDDVYRDNRQDRGTPRSRRTFDADLAAYKAWCKSRKHVPHPASITPEHPIALQRLGIGRLKAAAKYRTTAAGKKESIFWKKRRAK